MGRSVSPALAGLILAFVTPAAAQAAQPTDVASVDRQLVEAGQWLERAGAAMASATDGFQELNQRLQALSATRPTREQAMAAAPAIRQLIERCRESIHRSNAALAALEPYPQSAGPFIPRQLVADARAQNGRLLQLVDDYDDFLGALGRGDMAAMNRVLPRIMEGAFALIGHQRLNVRNRQAMAKDTEVAHQALGVIGEVYHGMEAVTRHWMAARQSDGAGAAKAAEALGGELASVARNSRALAVEGRANLKRHLAEIETARQQRMSADEKRLIDRVHRSALVGEKVFALADRLASFAEANAGISAAALLADGRPALLPELVAMEESYMALSQEQSSLLADGAP